MKRAVRKKIRELKDRYTKEELRNISLPVLCKLESHPLFHQAATVALYWSMDDEVYTHDFIDKWAKEKNILLPCIVGDDIVFRQYKGTYEMSPGVSYNISEPCGTEMWSVEDIDLIIVPGVAFDHLKNRLGRGKGYYDRYLQQCPAYKIGICFPFQYLSDRIPTDEYDVKMDEVLTEKC